MFWNWSWQPDGLLWIIHDTPIQWKIVSMHFCWVTLFKIDQDLNFIITKCVNNNPNVFLLKIKYIILQLLLYRHIDGLLWNIYNPLVVSMHLCWKTIFRINRPRIFWLLWLLISCKLSIGLQYLLRSKFKMVAVIVCQSFLLVYAGNFVMCRSYYRVKTLYSSFWNKWFGQNS